MGTLRTSRSALTCTTDFVGSGSCGAATGVIIQGSARQPAALRGNAPSCSVCLAGGADGQTPSVTRLGSPARETGSRVDGRPSAAFLEVKFVGTGPRTTRICGHRHAPILFCLSADKLGFRFADRQRWVVGLVTGGASQFAVALVRRRPPTAALFLRNPSVLCAVGCLRRSPPAPHELAIRRGSRGGAVRFAARRLSPFPGPAASVGDYLLKAGGIIRFASCD